MWLWILNHRTDLEVAALFGLFFAVVFGVIIAVVFEIFNLGGTIRDRIRHYRNRLAEQSTALLRKRIAEQEAYRNMIASEVGRYTAALRSLFVVLSAFGVAALLALFANSPISESLNQILTWPVRRSQSWVVAEFDIAAMLYLSVAIFAAFVGVNLTRLDTKEKVKKRVENLDRDLASMRSKLATLETLNGVKT